MIASIVRALTSRAAGPTATAFALVLSAILALTWSSGEAKRAALEAKVAELSQQSERSASLWRAQLAACHAASGADRLTQAGYQAPASPEEAARKLLAEGPQGIDVCARMESADQAVLATLK